MELKIEPANITNLEECYNLVNNAYKVEIGSTGIAFKNCDRYCNTNEVLQHINTNQMLILKRIMMPHQGVKVIISLKTKMIQIMKLYL